ncbi:hypothetical protein ALO_03216 [Acetonema longum DSM 6540]|uniref:Uncharacterized protein n=1 Tax=Acetonema longum DSM 6540 TaxID=1009370 RepID=F7NF24_9FIRM|nr:hypothetical protein ALO_03216 [Acetonema longum DSM 6540]
MSKTQSMLAMVLLTFTLVFDSFEILNKAGFQ